jgi:hypothetical protein
MWTVGVLDMVAVGLLDAVAVGLLDGVLRSIVVVRTVVSTLYCTLVSFSFTLSLFSFSFHPLFLPFEVDLVSREQVLNVSVLDICRWGGNCECTRRCIWECAFRCGTMCKGCCCGSGSLPLEYLDRHWEWLNTIVWELSEVVGDLLVLGRVCRGNAL